MHVATASLDSLTEFLQVRGWMASGDRVTGRTCLREGEAATTVRVTADAGPPRILRQGAAVHDDETGRSTTVVDRVGVEGEFYRLVQSSPTASASMPACLGVDRSDRIVALEDLGAASALHALYDGSMLSPADAAQLTAYLVALHGIDAADADFDPVDLDVMRRARHAQRFEEPIAPRRVEALAARVPGLERRVDAIRTDLHIRATMRDIGGRFLEGRGVLLHGDFRPARWMPSPGGLRVLGPGFASAGPASLDVGFFVAHLLLARQPHALVARVLERYRREAPLDLADVSACVGLEIIRGRLGRRPVPCDPSPPRLIDELDYATRLLRGGATVELPL